MMKITVTFFSDGESIDKVYEGNEGAAMLALIDADEHIEKGGFCLLDDGNVAQLIERSPFKR
jgi:hypothetical protein